MRRFVALIAFFSLTALASPAGAVSLPLASNTGEALPPIDISVTHIDAPAPPRSAGAADGALREAIALKQYGISQYSGTIQDNEAVVEVVHDLTPAAASGLITREGGDVLSESPGGVTEALVPLDQIATLEASPGVRYVRTPLRASVPEASSPNLFIGDEIAQTNTDAWQDAGYLGAGVKVGMIDFFDGDLWTEAQDAGEVPEPAGTFCQLFGNPCNIFDPNLGDPHGIATSEIVHEMAPQAEIYIAFAYTTADTQAAVDYFASQGVDIISRSLTSTFDGPGDGTGPLDDVVDSAVEQGMVWVNSAGNSSSSSGTDNGSYWRGTWSDPDDNGFLNFSGNDETLGFYCGFLNGLRWNDWSGNATDYDVYIFDTIGDIQTFTPKYVSANDQTGGYDPLEIVDNGPPCNGGSDVDYLAIRLYDAGNGTASDVLELMGNGTAFEYSQNPYSAAGPASDSANPGMMSAGALANDSNTIASYSSQGPTNDERIKPDLAAASCVDSYAYQPGCFAGTSAAAPAVAGATALVIGSGLGGDPVSARIWLLDNATVDRGAAGPDNVYGAGQLFMPPPPADTDADARTDSADNCPNWYNPTQALPPWTVATDDPDCDGFSTAIETTVGTDPLVQCQSGGTPDAWPADNNLDGVVTISDILALKPVFSETVPPAPVRLDLVPNGLISISDVLAHKPFFGQTCTP